MNSFFLTAGLFSAVTTFVHGWFGGREIATPLLAARDMHPVAKYTSYSCWHMVSIVLATMTGCYFYAAYRPAGADLAFLATVLALAFALWNLVLVAWKRQGFCTMPQWALFLAIAVAGGIGLVV